MTNGKVYARLRILDNPRLLNGTQRAQHPDQMPDLNFKKAKMEGGRRGRRSCSDQAHRHKNGAD